MSHSTDLFTLNVRTYGNGSLWGRRHLGPSRWAIDLGRFSLILEFWWRRKP